MRRVPENYSKLGRTLFAILLIVSLLLAGCAKHPGGREQMPPSEPANNTEASEPVREPGQEPSVHAPDDSSLIIFRQTMVETPQLFAAAFLGYAEQNSEGGADPFALMQESAPQLCRDLPFLMNIPTVIGTSGYLFCIVPADEHATVAVNLVSWDAEAQLYEFADVLYRSESGKPILVLCPNRDGIPDTEIVITDSNGNTAVWYPHLDSSYAVAPVYRDDGENLIFDFSDYDNLPNTDLIPRIGSSELVGVWELSWTEVEGDRNEAESGACTVEITSDDMGFFRFTYTDRDFPDWNVANRELVVLPGELYPGCGNSQWIAEVTGESGETVHYTLTLPEDGTLLLQIGWSMDGIPMVSYGWYTQIN